jgi:hypothetical protein
MSRMKICPIGLSLHRERFFYNWFSSKLLEQPLLNNVGDDDDVELGSLTHPFSSSCILIVECLLMH